MATAKSVPHNDAVKLNAADRRQIAIDLRRTGASLSVIAAETGVSREQARKDLERAFAELQEQQNIKAEALRTMELERLEELHYKLWPKALGDDTTPPSYNAIDRLIKIAERRAKLLGLDAPAKIAQTDAEGRTVAFNVMLSPPPTTPPDAPDSED